MQGKMTLCYCVLLFVFLAGSLNAAIGDSWNATDAYQSGIDQSTDPNLLPWSYHAPDGHLLEWRVGGQWESGFDLYAYNDASGPEQIPVLWKGETFHGEPASDPNTIAGHGDYIIRWTSPVDSGVYTPIKVDGFIYQFGNRELGRVATWTLLHNGNALSNGTVPTDAGGALEGIENSVGFETGTGGQSACYIQVMEGDTVDVLVGGICFAGVHMEISQDCLPCLCLYELTIETSPSHISSVTPGVGVWSFVHCQEVSLNAQEYVQCPEVWEFDHWEGDVVDPNSADTTTWMLDDKTVTAVYTDARECGDECHPNPEGDVTGDCRVNLEDVAVLSAHWLESTHPDDD